MDLNQWLEQEKGRSGALAAHIGVSRAAVSQWKTNGVPLGHMKTVREFTQGEVTLEEMVPGPDTGSHHEGRPLVDVATARGEEPAEAKAG